MGWPKREKKVCEEKSFKRRQTGSVKNINNHFTTQMGFISDWATNRKKEPEILITSDDNGESGKYAVKKEKKDRQQDRGRNMRLRE